MAMSLDASTFETICPSQYITFTIPHPTHPLSLLRVAVLDSPAPPPSSPLAAAMLVPLSRESDWLFSTHSGHLHLLLSSPIPLSRLILIGNQINNTPSSSSSVYRRSPESSFHRRDLEVCSKPLLFALSPRILLKNRNLEVPILSYDDNVVSSVVVDKFVGCLVGEMLVEDVEVEIESEDGTFRREFRRRLRFKRMPNLIQTEILVVPEKGDFEVTSVGIGEVKFVPDLSVLVHPYLAPMVASLALVCEYIEGKVGLGFRPRGLCLGVGGGALLSFLRNKLDFEVLGVDADEEVLRVAKRYFGLEDCEFMHVVVGDAVEFVKKLLRKAKRRKGHCHIVDGEHVECRFDVIMVDLDSSNLRSGMSAPPLEFVEKNVLMAAKSLLLEHGIFCMNVISPSRSFYCKLVHHFQEVFAELYKIDVGNGENFVFVASVSPLLSSVGECRNSFLMRLKSVIPEVYINSITKISD